MGSNVPPIMPILLTPASALRWLAQPPTARVLFPERDLLRDRPRLGLKERADRLEERRDPFPRRRGNRHHGPPAIRERRGERAPPGPGLRKVQLVRGDDGGAIGEGGR